MDKRGYVMSGVSFLLVLPAIMLFMVFIDMTSTGIEGNSRVIQSSYVLNDAKDLEENIEITGKQVFKSEAENVVKTGIPLSNSRQSIKENMQIKMNQITQEVKDNNGIEEECNITSVSSSEDPFAVEVNSSIKVRKDDVTHQEHISQDITILDPQYPTPNPLPFIKCHNYGGVQLANSRISFGYSLSKYLESRGVENAAAYENATTPLIIKKCPYDPYIMHGRKEFKTLKNCIENGYFHESSDGSCFLCRLEGKGTCPHYGMETYIIPSPLTNISSNSTNLTFNTAPSSIDHVIFNDTPPGSGTYPGKKIIYLSEGGNLLILYLDNAHRQKYGFPLA
jgi:hypothetical protein